MTYFGGNLRVVVVTVTLALVTSTVGEMATVSEETCCCLWTGEDWSQRCTHCTISAVRIDSFLDSFLPPLTTPPSHRERHWAEVRPRLRFKLPLACPHKPSPPASPNDLTYDTSVQVDTCDPLVGSGDQQLALDELLDGQHDAVLDAQADRGTRVLDGLVGVLNL